ncbi:hypothetical protein KIW84_056337 [Lathyrus oleraceus]|uniref:DNA topoisomerase type IA zn finger domain-containing protein n=1 Tax=Pisum sativum TaxID=3888 RepID=A0A9D5AKY4_PEA|nr:hypothetical protein KIW84_056337 [Pisum sativum]
MSSWIDSGFLHLKLLDHSSDEKSEGNGKGVQSVANLASYPLKSLQEQNFTIPVRPLNFSFKPGATSDMVAETVSSHKLNNRRNGLGFFRHPVMDWGKNTRSTRVGSEHQNTTEEVVQRCRLCQESDMVLKKNRDSKFMFGCLGYPQCRNVVWLPGSISEAVVTTNTCNNFTPGPVFLISIQVSTAGNTTKLQCQPFGLHWCSSSGTFATL